MREHESIRLAFSLLKSDVGGPSTESQTIPENFDMTEKWSPQYNERQCFSGGKRGRRERGRDSVFAVCLCDGPKHVFDKMANAKRKGLVARFCVVQTEPNVEASAVEAFFR